MATQLPDLEAATDAGIVADNIRAVGVVYSVWLLEQAAVFGVLDRIVELFNQGRLPLGRGPASSGRSIVPGRLSFNLEIRTSRVQFSWFVSGARP